MHKTRLEKDPADVQNKLTSNKRLFTRKTYVNFYGGF